MKALDFEAIKVESTRHKTDKETVNKRMNESRRL